MEHKCINYLYLTTTQVLSNIFSIQYLSQNVHLCIRKLYKQDLALNFSMNSHEHFCKSSTSFKDPFSINTCNVFSSLK